MAKNKKKPEKSKEQIHQEIKETMAKISRIDLSELSDDIKIREELGVDSLMAMEMLANLERQFNVKIDETELEKVQTIGDFVTILLKKVIIEK